MTYPSSGAAAELFRLAKLGRQAEARAEARRGCLRGLFSLVAYAFGRAYWLMLGVGVIHNDWIPALPPLGYWTAVAIMALLGLGGVFEKFKAPKKDGAS